MNEVVITAALRTAVGKFNGSLAKIPASDLGAQIIKALLVHTGVKAEQLSEVIMGQVQRSRSKLCMANTLKSCTGGLGEILRV